MGQAPKEAEDDLEAILGRTRVPLVPGSIEARVPTAAPQPAPSGEADGQRPGPGCSQTPVLPLSLPDTPRLGAWREHRAVCPWAQPLATAAPGSGHLSWSDSRTPLPSTPAKTRDVPTRFPKSNASLWAGAAVDGHEPRPQETSRDPCPPPRGPRS